MIGYEKKGTGGHLKVRVVPTGRSGGLCGVVVLAPCKGKPTAGKEERGEERGGERKGEEKRR